MQKSTRAINPEAKKVTTMTTAAACHNSFQVGQVTFLSSCCVSRKKFAAFCTITSSCYIESLIPCQNSLEKQAWQDSNLQHAVLETAALPIGATGLCPVCSEKIYFFSRKRIRLRQLGQYFFRSILSGFCFLFFRVQ
jgi:hypothetical protein